MSAADDLRAELAVAKAHGKGTDAARIKKQLAAVEPPAEAKPERAAASTKRAAAARDDEGAQTRAPSGRTSPRERQTKS